jgi:hypothetical protein
VLNDKRRSLLVNLKALGKQWLRILSWPRSHPGTSQIQSGQLAWYIVMDVDDAIKVKRSPCSVCVCVCVYQVI